MKPQLKGVFDSTMKYIFGDDYSTQGIYILCYTHTHYPTLVLSSETLTERYFASVDKTGGYDIPAQYPPNHYEYVVNTNLSARFVDKNGNHLHGPHFIIGGGFENTWGLGYLCENLIRNVIPTIFGSIIPFHTLIVSWLKPFFDFITEVSLSTIYVETISFEEFYQFNLLINKFQFSYQSLFMVGQTICKSNSWNCF